MKKIFFMAVSAVLLAAGCQKTEIQNEALTPIGFNTHMGKLTKAPDAENSGLYANLVEQDFRVWGYFVTEGDLNYKPGDNYFGPKPTELTDGIDVTVTNEYDEDGNPVCNTGEEIYYWPGKGKELDLYAVSLWNKTGTDVNNYTKVEINPTSHILTVTDFVVNNDADDDLMVAPLIRQDQDDSKYVAPQFEHALTKVLVNFKSTQATGVYVVSAKITGVMPSGTLTVNNDLPKEDPTSGAKKATARFSWAQSGSPTEYTADCKTAPVEGGIDAAASGETTTQNYKTAVAINNSGFLTYGSWLLIPQANIDNVTLVVEYIVEGIFVEQTFDLTPEGATVTAWERNKQTSYNVLISPGYIDFEPDVKDWTEGNTNVENRGDYSN